MRAVSPPLPIGQHDPPPHPAHAPEPAHDTSCPSCGTATRPPVRPLPGQLRQQASTHRSPSFGPPVVGGGGGNWRPETRPTAEPAPDDGRRRYVRAEIPRFVQHAAGQAETNAEGGRVSPPCCRGCRPTSSVGNPPTAASSYGRGVEAACDRRVEDQLILRRVLMN